jgi:uncharacterized membrane protein
MATSEARTDDPGLSLDRLTAFTDGVFAIAITLLVLEIPLPHLPNGAPAHELATKLGDLWPHALSYVISFVVIGIYWVVHHRMFRFIRRADTMLLRLNLLFLLFIAVMPLPTALIGEYGNYQIAVVLYAATLACTGFAGTALWWYSTWNRRLVDPDLPRLTIMQFRFGGLVVPIVFLLSIPLTFLGQGYAQYSWAALFVLDPVVDRAIQWLARTREE